MYNWIINMPPHILQSPPAPKKPPRPAAQPNTSSSKGTGSDTVPGNVPPLDQAAKPSSKGVGCITVKEQVSNGCASTSCLICSACRLNMIQLHM